MGPRVRVLSSPRRRPVLAYTSSTRVTVTATPRWGGTSVCQVDVAQSEGRNHRTFAVVHRRYPQTTTRRKLQRNADSFICMYFVIFNILSEVYGNWIIINIIYIYIKEKVVECGAYLVKISSFLLNN